MLVQVFFHEGFSGFCCRVNPANEFFSGRLIDTAPLHEQASGLSASWSPAEVFVIHENDGDPSMSLPYAHGVRCPQMAVKTVVLPKSAASRPRLRRVRTKRPRGWSLPAVGENARRLSRPVDMAVGSAVNELWIVARRDASRSCGRAGGGAVERRRGSVERCCSARRSAHELRALTARARLVHTPPTLGQGRGQIQEQQTV